MRAKQIDVLVSQTHISLLATLVAVLALASVLWPYTPPFSPRDLVCYGDPNRRGTVAEYVASDVIMARVCELGIDSAQGYGISRPQPIEKLFAAL